MNNNLIYDVHDKVPLRKNLILALQQVFSIIMATMLVPLLADGTGVYLSQSSALIGAGVGTIVYLLITNFKSPVVLGSSFAFILPLSTAVGFGYFGIFLGALFAGIVYVVFAILVKFVGTNWINKLMPPIVIGPIVALIGFSLATSAMNNLMNISVSEVNYNLLHILIGLVTFFVAVLISAKGNKKIKMYPFIIAILVGYAISVVLTLIGIWTGSEVLQIIDFSPFKKVADFSNWLPNLTFVGIFKEGTQKIGSFGDIVTIFIAYVPIAIVSFAEHIADHKNLSSIINKDLLKDPGLEKTLLGDGLGSIAGSFIGGCPNTTYGESIGCVALSKNASTRTIFVASIMCIIIAFFYPLVVFIETLPTCIIGGICIALYGFISVSGLRMFKDINLNDSKNLFVVASIFICGIGGLVLKIGSIEIPEIACALVVGIITNFLLKESKRSTKFSSKSKFIESKTTVQDTNKTPTEATENKTEND